MLIVSCVEFIPLQLPITVSFKCVLISINFNSFVCRVYATNYSLWIQSNHSELTSKTSTHLSFSALKWFEKVRGGSRGTRKQCTGTLHTLFGVVRLYRTFSNLIYTVVTRCVGYVYTVSEWFNPLEPPRTFSNHFSAEKARCVEVFDVSSEWFDYTEPSRTSSSQW